MMFSFKHFENDCVFIYNLNWPLIKSIIIFPNDNNDFRVISNKKRETMRCNYSLSIAVHHLIWINLFY